MKIKESDVDIIGPYPPPFGGVSLHIYRILPFLKKAGVGFRVFNQYDYESLNDGVIATKKSYLWWLKYIFSKKSKVVHIHHFTDIHFPYLLALSLFSRSKRVITIHHGKMLRYGKARWKMTVFIIKAARLSKVLIVQEELQQRLQGAGVKNVEWLPVYVPPQVTEPKLLKGDYDYNVVFNVGMPIGPRVIYVYSIDYFFQLAKDFPDIGFHFFLGDEGNKEETERYLSEQKSDNVSVYYLEQMVEYLASADVFIRPNRVDGYGISVQEAMDLNIPAIASDVCARAPGAQLYDGSSYEKLKECLEKVKSSDKNSMLEGKTSLDYHERLINIYKSLL
ncbi:MAG: glycosyltransferase [Marinobacterium sp.]|nr:glycosyltransferase [Marinobacterium sp.]